MNVVDTGRGGAVDELLQPRVNVWMPVLEGFLDGYTTRPSSHSKWVKSMEPYVTQSLTDGFELTDFRRVVDREVESITVGACLQGCDIAVVAYDDDGPDLEVTVGVNGDTTAVEDWLVSNVTPVADQ